MISPKAVTGGLESLRKGHQILQGALYVAAAARDAGHHATVVIADKTDIDAYIKRYDPGLIGFSCVTSSYPVARDMIRHVKKQHPAIPTIIGGHHATFMYRETIEDTGVDYVCRGEGEEVFPLLLDEIASGNIHPVIPGIVFYKDGEYHNDTEIAILDDLNKLPRITRDLVDPQFTFSPKIVSSRGCPFRCSFCSISAFYGGKYRQREVSAVIDDIQEYLRWGYNQFWFHDDNLTVDTVWVNEFCRQIEQKKLKFRWNCMSRLDVICREPQLFARMARCGCSLVSIGLESGIPEVLKRMRKQIGIPQVLKAVRILNGLKISHNWYMIIGSGDEYDAPRYIERNIDFFRQLPLDFVLISILTPYPGTELWDKLRSENRILHQDWEKYDMTHCVYRPLGISPTEMEKYFRRAYVRVYLSRGWRLIPIFVESFKRRAIPPRMIYHGFKAWLRSIITGESLQDVLRKQR